VEVCKNAKDECDAMNVSATAPAIVSTYATAAATTGAMETIVTRDLGSLPPLGSHPRRKKNMDACYKNPGAPSTLTGSCEDDGAGDRGNSQRTYNSNSSATGGAGSGSTVEQVQDPRQRLLGTCHSNQDLVSLPNARPHGRQQHHHQGQNSYQRQFPSQCYFQSRPVMISPHFRNKDILYTGPVLAHCTSPSNLLGIRHQHHPVPNNENVGPETGGTRSQLLTQTQQQTQSRTQARSQDELQQQQHLEEQGQNNPRQKTKRQSAREPRSGGVARSKSTESMYSSPGTTGSNSNMPVSASAIVAGNDASWLSSQNQITESQDNQQQELLQQEQVDVGVANVHKMASAGCGTPPKSTREGSGAQAPRGLKPMATPNQETLLPLLRVSQAHEDHHRHLLLEEQQQEQQGPVGLGIDMGGGRTATECHRRCNAKAKILTAQDSSSIDI